jgi:hypothetical protein
MLHRRRRVEAALGRYPCDLHGVQPETRCHTATLSVDVADALGVLIGFFFFNQETATLQMPYNIVEMVCLQTGHNPSMLSRIRS